MRPGSRRLSLGNSGPEGSLACFTHSQQGQLSRMVSTWLVSRLWSRARMNAISLRVFSSTISGSVDSQRRQLGAQTIAMLLTSIFVTDTFSGSANTYNRQHTPRHSNFQRQYRPSDSRNETHAGHVRRWYRHRLSRGGLGIPNLIPNKKFIKDRTCMHCSTAH